MKANKALLKLEGCQWLTWKPVQRPGYCADSVASKQVKVERTKLQLNMKKRFLNMEIGSKCVCDYLKSIQQAEKSHFVTVLRVASWDGPKRCPCYEILIDVFSSLLSEGPCLPKS